MLGGRTRAVDIRSNRRDLNTVAENADCSCDPGRVDERRQVFNDELALSAANLHMHDTVNVFRHAGYVCGAVVARESANAERCDVKGGDVTCVLIHTS